MKAVSKRLTCGRVVVRSVRLVDGLFDLVVGSLGVEVHRPREVHQRQVGIAQLLVHLSQWNKSGPLSLFHLYCCKSLPISAGPQRDHSTHENPSRFGSL